MRTNCVGLADLLCAYADGELTESNKQLVEDHLIICENCSAILKVYREISDSVNETNVPAPDALRIGVMNRIQSESVPGTVGRRQVSNTASQKKEGAKQRGRLNVLLTRYAPIAAGLVVMLLIWQFWGEMFTGRQNAMQTAAPAPAADSMPAAAPAPQAAPAPETAVNFDDMSESDSLADEEAFSFDAAAEAAPAALAEPEAPLLTDITRTTQETEEIMAYMSGAYAEITVTGDLPVLLAGHEPQPFGSWFGWEMVFEIPSSEVPALLAELGTRSGFSVSYQTDNRDSKYAVVLFSHG